MLFRYVATPWARAAVRRIAVVLALLLAISLGVFLLLHAAPGDPVRILLGTRPASTETIAAIRAQHDLDAPLASQYLSWLGNAAHLDFGRSIRTQEPVRDVVLDRMAFSAQLALFAFVLVMLTGVPLGVVAAVRRGRPSDHAISALGIIGSSTPAFVTGILLIYVFAVRIDLFPPFGEGGGGWDRVVHLMLPAVALALSAVAVIIKLTRTALAEVLDEDYITFARARGMAEHRVLLRYALQNALIPVVTAAGLILAYLITGAVLVEVTFDLPGLGSLLVSSVTQLDLPVVQGVTVMVAITVIAINLATDALYSVIDPRVRVARRTR